MISMTFINRHGKPVVEVNIRKETEKENDSENLTSRKSKADSLNCSVSFH